MTGVRKPSPGCRCDYVGQHVRSTTDRCPSIASSNSSASGQVRTWFVPLLTILRQTPPVSSLELSGLDGHRPQSGWSLKRGDHSHERLQPSIIAEHRSLTVTMAQGRDHRAKKSGHSRSYCPRAISWKAPYATWALRSTTRLRSPRKSPSECRAELPCSARNPLWRVRATSGLMCRAHHGSGVSSLQR
jgi:hypothetical protein